MLKRLLTAAILIPIVLGAIYVGPTHPILFQLVLAVFSGLGAWEWFNMTQRRPLWAGVGCMLLVMCWLLLSFLSRAHAATFVIMASMLLMLWYVVDYWVFRAVQQVSGVRVPFFGLLLGLLLFTVFPFALLLLLGEPQGPDKILLGFGIVWLSDTGAYLAGKYVRTSLLKGPMAPRISPNKTWRGLAGGLLSVLLACLIFWLIDWLPLGAGWPVMAIILPTWLAAVLGDLFESMYKRAAGIKDSGHILPGHGGMLDRIDALLFALPVYTTLLYSLG